MRFVREIKKIEPIKAKNENKKTSDGYDKPIPKPKMSLEDSISEHKGLSRENYGANLIL